MRRPEKNLLHQVFALTLEDTTIQYHVLWDFPWALTYYVELWEQWPTSMLLAVLLSCFHCCGTNVSTLCVFLELISPQSVQWAPKAKNYVFFCLECSIYNRPLTVRFRNSPTIHSCIETPVIHNLSFSSCASPFQVVRPTANARYTFPTRC
jgi:ribosomal protein S26